MPSVKNIGKPCAGKSHARFDEGGQVRACSLLYLVDPRWHHLNTAFCPLANGYVIAYEKAFSSQSVNKIKNEFSDRIIWVSDQDANNFACNAVNIGNDIILNKASDELKAELSKNNFSVIEVDVSEFIKAGGACKCLTLEL